MSNHGPEEGQAALSAVSSKQIKHLGEAVLECDECGAQIPEVRRRNLPGVHTCAECQMLAERGGKIMGQESGFA